MIRLMPCWTVPVGWAAPSSGERRSFFGDVVSQDVTVANGDLRNLACPLKKVEGAPGLMQLLFEFTRTRLPILRGTRPEACCRPRTWPEGVRLPVKRGY